MTDETSVGLFTNKKGEKMNIVEKCPGLYCGRQLIEGNLTECGACPRGSRVNVSYLCEPCTESLSTYDCLYLAFMAIVPLIIHFFSIDTNAQQRKFTKGELILHFSAFIEISLSALLTVLFSHPVWHLWIDACPVTRLSDWYTYLYNPTPNYEDPLICTHEAVFPRQTMILVFYLFCLLFMMILRPGLNAKYMPKRGKQAVYYALYIFPLLALLHGVAGGLIYYLFPYLSIVISVVSNATHFAIKLNQSMTSLLKTSVTEIRNIVIILGHWALLAYGIVSIPHHYGLLLLVPVPALFYILTSKYTHPDNFK